MKCQIIKDEPQINKPSIFLHRKANHKKFADHIKALSRAKFQTEYTLGYIFNLRKII